MKIKAITKIFLLSFLMISIYSCSTESDENQGATENLDFSKIEIDLSKSQFGNEIKLFDYTDKKHLISQLNASMNQIISDTNELIKNSEITDLILDITFSDGKAVISSIIELNSNTKKVSKAYYFDKKANVYKNYPPGDAGNLDLARCPSGYTQLASCSNLSNPQLCVSNAVAVYLTDEISSIGDCANVQVQVGTFTTKVCGKTC